MSQGKFIPLLDDTHDARLGNPSRTIVLIHSGVRATRPLPTLRHHTLHHAFSLVTGEAGSWLRGGGGRHCCKGRRRLLIYSSRHLSLTADVMRFLDVLMATHYLLVPFLVVTRLTDATALTSSIPVTSARCATVAEKLFGCCTCGAKV